MLLIKASATVTVYNAHHRTLLPALFIVCIGTIRNNSSVGGRALAEVRSSATELVMPYCTWKYIAYCNIICGGPSHGQRYHVQNIGEICLGDVDFDMGIYRQTTNIDKQTDLRTC